MSNFKYNYGLYIGRFQPLHIGHTSVIDKMLSECETVVIAVGSAQESGTEKNPLSFDLRKLLIYSVYSEYGDRVIVLPINDRKTYSDDPTWGDYLLDRVYEQCGLIPDVIYEGEESVRVHWYDNYNIPVVKVSRTHLPISGTELRKAIIEGNDIKAVIHLPNPVYLYYYDLIRKEIQNAATNARCNPVD